MSTKHFQSNVGKIETILRHPITYFIYGVYWFSFGVYFWQSQILTDFLISQNISPLLGLFITGCMMMIGYIWIIGNYAVAKKEFTKQFTLNVRNKS